MPGQDVIVLIDQHRLGEAEAFNAARNLLHLQLRMRARIARPGFKLAGRQVLDRRHAPLLLLCAAPHGEAVIEVASRLWPHCTQYQMDFFHDAVFLKLPGKRVVFPVIDS